MLNILIKIKNFCDKLKVLNDKIELPSYIYTESRKSGGGSHQQKTLMKPATKPPTKKSKKTPMKKSTKTQMKARRRTTVKRNKGPKVPLKKKSKKNKRIYVIHEKDIINTPL